MCLTLLSANTEGESMHSGAEKHGMWFLFSSLRQHLLFAFTSHNIHSMLRYYQMIGLAGKRRLTHSIHFKIFRASVNRAIN